MQFKHPELLYALFLLLIPIIIHLFQLRKFKREAFTNVAFLKDIKQNARKSSQIKKWLVLCTRLLLLTCIVFAFAQPFTSKNNASKSEKETVIYIDNSFSMQAKGQQGELLKRALQDLVSNISENEKVSILTNNRLYRSIELKAIKNDLLQLDYTSVNLPLESVFLKSKTLFSNNANSTKDLILISDFQQINNTDITFSDSLVNTFLVKLEPVNTNNISVDSTYISENTPGNLQINVVLKNTGKITENLPVSLFNEDQLIAKSTVNIDQSAETTFTLPTNQIINGRISIEDPNLRFDNSFFFNINNKEKIKVLAISENTDSSYLERIYTEQEFKLTSTQLNALSYNIIDSQNLIVLNELNNIPNPLISALQHFTAQGGSVIIIPSETINISSYNDLLMQYGTRFENLVSTEKNVTNINYSHPLFSKGVFEKRVSNFQYPKMQSFYEINQGNYTSVLNFEDGKPCLIQTNTTYVFSAALNNKNSNFKNWNVIVPTFYNIAKQSFKTPELYYTIGENNEFEVETQLKQDDILSLEYNGLNLIPRQRYFNNKVVINTYDTPDLANTYSVKNKEMAIKNVSYNYDRSESNLAYLDLTAIKNVNVSNSIANTFESIKSESKINALWKWFVIFALVFLIIEMLILKYFK